jgi:uncharacterized protein
MGHLTAKERLMPKPMRWWLCSLIWVLALVLLEAQAVGPGGEPGSKPVRVLIFSGQNNHDWRSTTPFLRQILLDTGRFDVRVTEEPRGITSATLAPYDVLVLDYMGPRWGEETERAVVDFVRSGKGLVAVHGASYAFTGMEILGDGHARTGRTEPPWPEYLEMVGGYWAKEEPATGHGRLHSFKVRFRDSSHPIAQGLGDSFIATDELYHHLRLRPEARILARAFSDPETGGTGKEEPILWTVHYGKGRVFYTALGHNVAAMREVGFVTTFARGAEWAATGKVTLPAGAF